ncbi:helix-turn-helix transcriptional regulator [Peptococcaceae bacterium 1198_IL3148]
MNISDRFKILREHLGLTQTLMAQELGIDRSHVGNIESASKKASDSLIKHVCVRYGVSECWLKNGTGKMFISPEERMKMLLEQLKKQPSVNAYYSYLVGNKLPLPDELPDHLQAQAHLLQQRKEAIKEDWKKRNPIINPESGATNNNLLDIQHKLANEADRLELEEMKKTLEELFDAGPSYREWAKIQFKYAFPETVVAQARAFRNKD